jgi:acyl carrier protein
MIFGTVFPRPVRRDFLPALLKLTSVVLAALVLCFGCGEKPAATGLPVEQVRAEVARLLKKNLKDVPVAQPLGDLGATESTMVELLLQLEDKLHVEFPESALGQPLAEAVKTITVEELAAIAAKQPPKK